MTPLWWHWIVLGMVLGLLELAVPSFFIIWFALGAGIVGMCLLAMPQMELTPQIVLWTSASIAFTVLWFRVLKRDGPSTRSGQPEEAIGEIGVLVAEIEPLGRGQVRFQKPLMGADVWPCIANEVIAAGERVRVLGVDGQLLRVGKN